MIQFLSLVRHEYVNEYRSHTLRIYHDMWRENDMIISWLNLLNMGVAQMIILCFIFLPLIFYLFNMVV